MDFNTPMNLARGGILVQGLRKVYGQGDTAVEALKHVGMAVGAGEVVGLVGPSGSGKSTLLKCLGAIIEPTAGRMVLADRGVPGRYGIGGLKAALDLQGFYGGPCRAPLGTPDGDGIEEIKESLASAGLL